MSEHELKTWPEFYRCLESGEKTFELRKDDRGFRAGDVLRLREWRRLRVVDGVAEGEYTGREMRRTVTYVLSGFGLERGYVALGLSPADSSLWEAQQQLVEKWREAAAFEAENSNPQYASALDQCADDLAALQPGSPQEP